MREMTFGELCDKVDVLRWAGCTRNERLIVNVAHADDPNDPLGCIIDMRRDTMTTSRHPNGEAIIFLDVELDAIEQHRPPE